MEPLMVIFPVLAGLMNTIFPFHMVAEEGRLTVIEEVFLHTIRSSLLLTVYEDETSIALSANPFIRTNSPLLAAISTLPLDFNAYPKPLALHIRFRATDELFVP